MDGETAFRGGRDDDGLDRQRRFVEIDDNLLCDEPWD